MTERLTAALASEAKAARMMEELEKCATLNSTGAVPATQSRSILCVLSSHQLSEAYPTLRARFQKINNKAFSIAKPAPVGIPVLPVPPHE
jgi:hypothetical protein